MRTWSPWPLASTVLLVAWIAQRTAAWGWPVGSPTPWVCATAVLTAALATWAARRGAAAPALLGPFVLALVGLLAERMQPNPRPDYFSDNPAFLGWAITLALVGTLSLATSWALRGRVASAARTKRERAVRALGFGTIVLAGVLSLARQSDGGSLVAFVVLVAGASIAWAVATTPVEPRAELRFAVAVSLAMIGTFALEQGIQVEQFLAGQPPPLMPSACTERASLVAAITDERRVMGCTLLALVPSLAVTVRLALRAPERLLITCGAALAALLFACTNVRDSFDDFLRTEILSVYASFPPDDRIDPVRVTAVPPEDLVCPRLDDAVGDAIIITATSEESAWRFVRRQREWHEYGAHSADVHVVRADRRVTLGRVIERFERYGPRPGVLALSFAVPGPFDRDLPWSELVAEVEATVSVGHRQSTSRERLVIFEDTQTVEEIVRSALALGGGAFATSRLPPDE